MSTRFLISALCVGAVAFACGPRSHNEASAPRKNQQAAQTQPAGAPGVRQQGAPRARKPVDASLSASLYVHASDSNVRLSLHVVNTTKKRVEVTFPSGQTYDFVILDSIGREMWRWGNGRMFTQTLRNRLLDGGESMELEESMSPASLPPGRYTARALLRSENYPLVEQTDFQVTGTTVASR